MYMIILTEVTKMDNKHKILSIVSEIEEKTIEVRRHLHKYPELSFCENETMKYICSRLDNMDIDYASEIAGTGVVATIKGEKKSCAPKTLLIRADIDALPITEKSDKEYASNNPGVMHACGHDCHTAILLSVCDIVNRLKSEFSGYVKCIFQPAEETTGGAKPMIDDGVLKNPDVDACIALHIDTDIQTGTIRVKSGPMYASPDNFKIDIIGKGGHGAEPEKCINPIIISADIIKELNTMMHNDIPKGDKAVVTVCSIHAGSASNIIPSSVEIVGTARSLTNEMRLFLKNRIREIVNEKCLLYNGEYKYEFTELYPPMINSESIAQRLCAVASNYSDIIDCIYGGEPTMAGEDFAYFTQNVPGVMFKLGCRNEEKGTIYPLHHESFDVDEECLKHGVTLLSAFALDYLK